MNSQINNLYSAKEKYKNLTVYQGKIVKKNLLGENFHRLESMRIYITIINANPEKKYYFECFDISEKEEILIKKSIQIIKQEIIVFIDPIEIKYDPIEDKRILIKIYRDNDILYYETDLNRLTESIQIEDKIDGINLERIQLSSLKFNKFVNFRFEINNICKVDFSQTKYKMLFQVVNNDILLYRSEVINEKGIFQPFAINENLLLPNYQVIFYNYEKKVIGKYIYDINSLQNKEIMKVQNICHLSKNKIIEIEDKSTIREDFIVQNLSIEKNYDKNVRISTSECYFNNIKLNKNYNQDKVNLNFILENCKPLTFYNLRIYYDENDTQIIFTTEDCKSKDDKLFFPKSLQLDYLFNKDRKLEVSIIFDENIKRLELTLNQILFSKNLIFEQRISNDAKEILKIKADKLYDDNQSFFQLNFEFSKLLNSSFYLNKIYYIMIINNEKIYKSDEINDENIIHYVNIPYKKIKGDNKNIIFDFYNFKKEKFYSINTNENELISEKIFEIPLSKYRKYTFKSLCKIIEPYSIINCIKDNELIIYPYFYIDFSLSNGEKNNNKCLHSLKEDELNDYEEVLSAYSKENLFYNSSNNFLLFGFGGEKNGKEIFELNSNINITKDNIIEEYKNNVKLIEFKDKRLFASIINDYIIKSKNDNNIIKNKFDLLFILTSGLCNDIEETKKAILELETFPIYIIIIGMGKANYDGFNELINNINFKENRKKITFLKFDSYKYNISELIEKSLNNVPEEIITYYLNKQITLKKI